MQTENHVELEEEPPVQGDIKSIAIIELESKRSVGPYENGWKWQENKCTIFACILWLPWFIFLLIMTCQPSSEAVHDIIIEHFDSTATSRLDPIKLDCTFTITNVIDHMDIFLIFHFLRHFFFGIIVRNYVLLWCLSIAWEILEYFLMSESIFDLNWDECWWDSIFFDIFGNNWLGFECSILLIRLLTNNEGLYLQFDRILCNCLWNYYNPMYHRLKKWTFCCGIINCQCCAKYSNSCTCGSKDKEEEKGKEKEKENADANDDYQFEQGINLDINININTNRNTQTHTHTDRNKNKFEQVDSNENGQNLKSIRDANSRYISHFGELGYKTGRCMYFVILVFVLVIMPSIEQSSAFLTFMIGFWIPPGFWIQMIRSMSFVSCGYMTGAQLFDIFFNKNSIMNKTINIETTLSFETNRCWYLGQVLKSVYWVCAFGICLVLETIIIVRAYVEDDRVA